MVMRVLPTLLVCLLGIPLAASAEPSRETLPGAANYTRVDTTVACGGATTAEAWPELQSRGFKAVVNLRQALEPGANIEEARSAATAAGLRYIHLPFSGSSPQASTVDAFIAAVSDPANSPVYMHCGTANRVGAVWLAKPAWRQK